jgi:hypothetical protein
MIVDDALLGFEQDDVQLYMDTDLRGPRLRKMSMARPPRQGVQLVWALGSPAKEFNVPKYTEPHEMFVSRHGHLALANMVEIVRAKPQTWAMRARNGDYKLWVRFAWAYDGKYEIFIVTDIGWEGQVPWAKLLEQQRRRLEE